MYSTGFNSKCKNCVNEEREGKPKVKYITRAELEEENKKLKEEIKEIEKSQEYRYHRCMKAERGGEDED